MSRRETTIAPDYFEKLYTADADPWKFATSDYERDKYADTLTALPQARYVSGLEIGCSIGVFTRQLATRCDRLVAVDAAAAALSEARRRCQDCANLTFAQMFVPGEWPKGQFDLVVLSEVVYYLDAADVAELATRVCAALAPRANVVLVHWTGETDYPLTGDQATELLIEKLGHHVDLIRSQRRVKYRLDVLVNRSGSGA